VNDTRHVHYPGTVAALPIAVLISGTGSNLAALIEASAQEGSPYRIVGVLADRHASGLAHAERAGIPTRVVRLSDHTDRAAWDRALADAVRGFDPQLVVLAGFMKLVGPAVLETFPGRILNTHPALLPSFPGAHGVRDALAAGVKVTGATVIEVDAGVDTGRILAQRAVDVRDDDTEPTLHERIKAVERDMLVDVVRDRAAALHQNPAPALGEP
jgi:phosphoribosylglycinamide formyltransferase-1